MSEWIEWDAFPDPPKRRRVVEILPPQQPELHVVHHYDSRSLQRWIMIAALVAVAVILVRSPSAMLMLWVLAGKYLAAGAAFAALLAIVAYRARRSGRPF
jgi:hypothetical protein